jgi:hypothetical protein
MRFCIRIDDIGFRPHYELDAELCLAQRLHEVFSGRPYLSAIIPGILDDVGQDWIRSRPAGMTPALHGWKHDMGARGGHNEFEEMPEPACLALLDQGLRLIHRDDTPPVVDFVPPFNAVTPELLKACAGTGLKRVWGQPYASPQPLSPERRPWGVFIPSWLPSYGISLWRASDERRSVVEVMRENSKSGNVFVVVLHLTWEASFSPELRGVRAILEEFGDDLISPDQYVHLAGIAE